MVHIEDSSDGQLLNVIDDAPVVLQIVEDAIPGPSGFALARRETSTTSPSLTTGQSNLGAIVLAKGYRVYAITTSAQARVRMYATVAAQSADVTRNTSTDPGPSSGVVFDVVTGNTNRFIFSPEALGASLELIPTTLVPITITAMVDGPVTVTVLWVPTE